MQLARLQSAHDGYCLRLGQLQSAPIPPRICIVTM
jgi:hypothetical protein